MFTKKVFEPTKYTCKESINFLDKVLKLSKTYYCVAGNNIPEFGVKIGNGLRISFGKLATDPGYLVVIKMVGNKAILERYQSQTYIGTVELIYR